MKIICIDVGNTHTRIVLFEDNHCETLLNIKSQSYIEESAYLRSQLKPYCTLPFSFCSVSPRHTEVFHDIFNDLGIDFYELKHNNCPQLTIDYPNPSEIGPDRLANAIAAKSNYTCPCIVIDMGTAVTFDIIDADGAYIGGIIAPGMEIMTRYLHEQTALLPELSIENLQTSKRIGKSTVEAIQTGCIIGFSGMIQALLDSVIEELQSSIEPVVIGTGGCSRQLLKNITPEIIIDENITLKGIAQAWVFQKAE